MEELQHDFRNEDKTVLVNSQRSSSEESDTLGHLKSNLIESGSIDNENFVNKRILKRVTRFSDSDSDCDTEKAQNEFLLESNNSQHENLQQSDDSEKDSIVHKSQPYKSRIQTNRYLSGSEDSENDNTNKLKEHQMRIKNKKNRLHNKFKALITSREKEPSPANSDKEMKRQSDHGSSNDSGEEMASIEKIKQKIKERMSFKPSICDPDTSDEESSPKKSVYKQKKERKYTKLTSPKPQRMSAKQAMENMQKIKSESNRMLREKEVSLPYHRPKALSLKDIMSKRKLAVSSDGKALPIKMNEQQLKQYAQMLEERQKEMMELCKSESEEEVEINNDPTDYEKNTTGNEENNINLDAQGHTETIDINIECSSSNTLLQDVSIENIIENSSTNKADLLMKEMDCEIETQLNINPNNSIHSLIDEQITTQVKEAESSLLLSETNDVAAISKDTEVKTVCTDIVDENEMMNKHKSSSQINTEVDSQIISLHFNTVNTENSIGNMLTSKLTKDVTKDLDENLESPKNNLESNVTDQDEEKSIDSEVMEVDNEFSDDDINIADIDNIIENAEIIKDIEDKVNSQFLVRDKPLNLNPKLTGSPGMVIDLYDSDTVPKKSGIELLKERFTYFSRLKTPEEKERERETKLKPGTQLQKLKQELEEKIAEQRSLEWAKRLEDEKQQRRELKELRGEESEDDIDKIEAAIEDSEEIREEAEESENEEEEPLENDVKIKDKPRVKCAMVDDEAEESECDENEGNNENIHAVQQNEDDDDGIAADDDEDEEENESESDSSDESSESEDEQPSTTKKGRILKAFEDSDEEDIPRLNNHTIVKMHEVKEKVESTSGSSSVVFNYVACETASQDDELQLAQRTKSTSDDLFTSQESVLLPLSAKEQSKDVVESEETFTQTFSILDSSKQANAGLDLINSGKLSSPVGVTQSLDINDIEDVICPVNDSQQLPLPSQIPTTPLSQSQPIGEDILALCTGQFYNNKFVSQIQDQLPLSDSQNYDAFDNYPSQESQEEGNISDEVPTSIVNGVLQDSVTINVEPKVADDFIELNGIEENKENVKHKTVDNNLISILDELADPEFDSPKPNKFFVGGNSKNTQKDVPNENQNKKKFIIESDDETSKGEECKKTKKFKKKKLEKRVLQISDDEEELSEVEDEIEENESDIEEDNPERLVEYDSEENEIEVKIQNPKKKRKMAEFFENEAELTSEDEWVGSGDEDEAGLDRMEREEGDDDTFHQGKLQRELGQIHMRDVLDQDKREVRLIQELLFEDGDLGGGGRQRKFRWNNMDGDEETGTVPDEVADTQEEEFESEEQWRKQRHERQIFLRELQDKDDQEESLNVSVNRTTIIKANLSSKNISSLVMEVNSSTNENTANLVLEKKTAKDVPSPMKPFALLQPNYQGSLLSRGRGALARLAALATPLAADDDSKVGTLGPTSRRNFVFTALTPEEKEPKVTKRKAEINPSTPKLVKKMRTEEKQINSKNSLLDHFM